MNKPNKIHYLESEGLHAICGKQIRGIKVYSKKLNGELITIRGMSKLLDYVSSNYNSISLTTRCNQCSKKLGMSYDKKTTKERYIETVLHMGRGYI
jgi:hypothetical protein